MGHWLGVSVRKHGRALLIDRYVSYPETGAGPARQEMPNGVPYNPEHFPFDKEFIIWTFQSPTELPPKG